MGLMVAGGGGSGGAELSSWIGVPDPPFGIEEEAPARPSPWTSEVAGYYYIDRTESGATDSGRTYGYPGAARLTIPNPIPAGSRVEVANSYDAGSASTVTRLNSEGTAESPVFVVSHATNQGVFDREHTVEGSYMIIEGFLIQRVVRTREISGASPDHIAWRNNEFTFPTATSGMLGIGGFDATDNATYIVVYNNDFHDLGDWDDPADTDTDQHAIAPGFHSHHVWILNNTIARVAGNAIQVSGQHSPRDTSEVTHIYIAGNTATQTRQSSVGVKESQDVVISQNDFSATHIRQSGNWSAGVTYQYGPERLWIIFNTIHDTDTGIKATSPADVGDGHIVGNVFYDIEPDITNAPEGTDPETSVVAGTALRMAGGATQEWVNNTIYSVWMGAGSDVNSTATTIDLANNIIATTTHRDFVYISGTVWDQTVMRNCIVHDPFQAGDEVRWTGSVEDLEDGVTLTAYQSANPDRMQDCQSADPLFTDAASQDFTLQATSPAIDAGIEHSVYDDFEALYPGLSIRYDRAGNPRPAGSTGWDIGAYERQ